MRRCTLYQDGAAIEWRRITETLEMKPAIDVFFIKYLSAVDTLMLILIRQIS